MQKKILIGSFIIILLAIAFFWGGNAPESETVSAPTATDAPQTPLPTEEVEEELPKEEVSATETATLAPTEVPTTSAPKEEESLICTLSVNCSTVLSNMEYLTAGKESVIPANGVILPPTEVPFFEGENVFQVLRRTLKAEGVHFEFQNTPIYNTAYIEGIGNLYEFDCGELSGWVYRVNGVFPGYGCSRYVLQGGERIEFLYTLNLGEDVGGNNIPK